MPPRNEQIAKMVRTEIAKNPEVGNDVLREKASAIDRGIRRLSRRQFHTTYRLPALRATTKAKPRAAKGEGSSSGPKHRAREVLVDAPEIQAAAPAASPSPAPRAPEPPTQQPPSNAPARPNAAEREMVRQVLQSVAREALAADDRAAFVRLLSSLDDRATRILGVFGKA